MSNKQTPPKPQVFSTFVDGIGRQPKHVVDITDDARRTAPPAKPDKAGSFQDSLKKALPPGHASTPASENAAVVASTARGLPYRRVFTDATAIPHDSSDIRISRR